MRAAAAFWDWLISHLPAMPVPSWFATAHDSIAGVVSHIGGLGRWFPFGVLGTVLATFFLILAAGVAVKVVRIIASFFTAGGGSAG